MSEDRIPGLDPGALERLARAAREGATGPALDRYEIVREIGRGASGVVVEARDLELGRPVALKLLTTAGELSPDARARFLREARAAARLSHPSIAAVYDANEAFIAMELVDGVDLAARPVRDPRVLASLVRDAALAAHYAHSRGIVHRDLKPANLIATSEVPPRVVVTDFGLAKGTETGADLSRSGSVVGTPAYMAPEQARGGTGVDARTDVYGLGATLYDQLAGRPPFVGGSVIEVLRRVVEEDPAPLATVAPGVDRDLATIAQKCLAKEPDRRYASALALAGDLDRWLSGEPILARPPSLSHRARRFLARRQGQLVAGLAAALLALLLVAPFWLRARERRASAERALVLAETVGGALDHARALRSRRRPAEAAAVLEEARRAALAFAEHADVARASLFLGRLHAALGRMEEAARAFDRALELAPELSEARFERGLARGVLVRGGTRPGEAPSPGVERLRAGAIADLSEKPAGAGPVPSEKTAWGLGLLAWLRGDSRLAERHCQTVLEIDPAHVEARVLLARIASEAGQVERAMFLSAEAVDVMGGMGQAERARLQVGSVEVEAAWTVLPGRREVILDLRRAATAAPTETFASGALALEGLEAGARALAAGDASAALRDLEAAEGHLTKALQAADSDPAILAARGVCALLRDEALSVLGRADEAAKAREAASSDFDVASRLGAAEVRVAAWWNESLLEERRGGLALVAGDAAAAEKAREQAASARGRALAASAPGSELAGLLREGASDR
ncbi:MAG: protein kinase [Planctomycetes bacterium]|nr:protein kinase [Planctomycetota bacterium]